LRIQIIGLGTVGMATAYLFNKLGHEVLVYDIQPKESPYGEFVETIQTEVDVTFICTPEARVREVVDSLKKEDVKGLYVIRGTTPPETTANLMRKYECHICHNPEFLRERHAFQDIENPPFVLIGYCCRKHGNSLRSLYEFLKCPIFLTDPTTSEITKLAMNAYLSMLITFWNELHELCSTLGSNTGVVATIAKSDPRVSQYGTLFFGKKFGGKCLPKDLNQLIGVFRQHKLNPILFEAVKEYNDRL